MADDTLLADFRKKKLNGFLLIQRLLRASPSPGRTKRNRPTWVGGGDGTSFLQKGQMISGKDSNIRQGWHSSKA